MSRSTARIAWLSIVALFARRALGFTQISPLVATSRRIIGTAGPLTTAGGIFGELEQGLQKLRKQLGSSTAAGNSSMLGTGVVVRCAAKHQNRSRATGWTTSKPEVGGFAVTQAGAVGDYNHYRATVLKGTPDRALSILTTSVLQSLTREGWPVQRGDLGENVFVDQIDYSAFAVGRTFAFGSAVVQVTEAIAPCSYLCTLAYLTNKAKCVQFIRTLQGRRGWYARVLVTGSVHTGDPVKRLS